MPDTRPGPSSVFPLRTDTIIAPQGISHRGKEVLNGAQDTYLGVDSSSLNEAMGSQVRQFSSALRQYFVPLRRESKTHNTRPSILDS